MNKTPIFTPKINMDTYKMFYPGLGIVDACDIEFTCSKQEMNFFLWMILKDKTHEELDIFIKRQLDKENYENIDFIKQIVKNLHKDYEFKV